MPPGNWTPARGADKAEGMGFIAQGLEPALRELPAADRAAPEGLLRGHGWRGPCP